MEVVCGCRVNLLGSRGGYIWIWFRCIAHQVGSHCGGKAVKQDLEEHPQEADSVAQMEGCSWGESLACVVAGSAQQPEPSSGGVRTGFSFGTGLEQQRAAPGQGGLQGCG